MPGIHLDFGSNYEMIHTAFAAVDITDSVVIDLTASQSIDSTTTARNMAQIIMPEPIVKYVGIRYSIESLSSFTVLGDGDIVFNYTDGYRSSNGGSSERQALGSIPDADIQNKRLSQKTVWYEIDNTTWNYIGFE